MKTMKTPIIEEKILEWLIETRKSTVSSHEILEDCRNWMISRYGFEGNLAVERKWRSLRNRRMDDGKKLLEVKELDTPGRQSTWQIISFRGMPWNAFL